MESSANSRRLRPACKPFSAVSADIVGDHAASRRMADEGRIAKVQFLKEFVEIIGIGIHVVALPRLVGTAVTSAVHGDAAIPIRCQEEHLILKRIGGQRPAMIEDYWLTGAPVLVVHLHSVFG